MDAGASMGIVDGIQFALDGNPELEIILTDISEDKIAMLKECGQTAKNILGHFRTVSNILSMSFDFGGKRNVSKS